MVYEKSNTLFTVPSLSVNHSSTPDIFNNYPKCICIQQQLSLFIVCYLAIFLCFTNITFDENKAIHVEIKILYTSLIVKTGIRRQ